MTKRMSVLLLFRCFFFFARCHQLFFLLLLLHFLLFYLVIWTNKLKSFFACKQCIKIKRGSLEEWRNRGRKEGRKEGKEEGRKEERGMKQANERPNSNDKSWRWEVGGVKGWKKSSKKKRFQLKMLIYLGRIEIIWKNLNFLKYCFLNWRKKIFFFLFFVGKRCSFWNNLINDHSVFCSHFFFFFVIMKLYPNI